MQPAIGNALQDFEGTLAELPLNFVTRWIEPLLVLHKSFDAPLGRIAVRLKLTFEEITLVLGEKEKVLEINSESVVGT